jgi:hypothetical protein
MGPSFTAAYVITSDGRDIHADMALVSMISVRITNPGLRIVAVCDSQSAQAIRSEQHAVLESCDDLIEVTTPDGDPVFKNRWIKTQLYRFVAGDVLFIDADTLVRSSLSALPELVADFGAIPNHNGQLFSEQIWDGEHSYLEEMGWSYEFQNYFNGGIWFYRRNSVTESFFQMWHDLWLECVQTNGRTRDQPSLNTALLRLGIEVTVLPSAFNSQVVYNWHSGRDAYIWHFFNSMDLSESCFKDLLVSAKTLSIKRLKRKIASAIRMLEPWPNHDFVARLIISNPRNGTPAMPSVAEQLWLKNRRLDFLRFICGRIRAKIKGLVLR